MQKNIFIVGLDEFNLSMLKRLTHSEDYNFVGVLSYDEVVRPREYRLPERLEKAINQIRAFPGSVDAIVSYWDFPSSTILPILRQEFGLPGPSLEAVLKCEHKYWSRLAQREAVPEIVPQFCAVDPFAHDPLSQITLDFPFWIKPVKAHSSHLGFKVRSGEEFERVLPQIRQGIERWAEPFNYILSFAELPEEVAAADGYHCIAEEIISAGRQCTLEGYVFQGEIKVYGVIDSIREGKYRSSFARYQYPSRLPQAVQQRMIDATKRFVGHIGYDDAPFNIEFYWDAGRDTISLLEINSRISKSHSPLFELVDGVSHQEVMIDLALGRRPDMPHRQGRYRLAAKFMVRVFGDGIVTRVPDRADVERVESAFPGTRFRLIAYEGERLSGLPLQDSYSYELAEIFMGAHTQKELLANYRKALEILDYRVESLPREAA